MQTFDQALIVTSAARVADGLYLVCAGRCVQGFGHEL